MNSARDAVLARWHRMLALAPHERTWYRDRLREELQEQRRAVRCIHRLSETSDVLFSISRARHDGFPICSLPPLAASQHSLVYAYMLAKYTSRWGFYRTAAFLCDASHYRSVREVVNPNKDEKLVAVACRHGMDPTRFTRVGRVLRRVWPLLP